MPPAAVPLESHADRQGIWLEAMRIQIAEAIREIYPEAEITQDRFPGPTQCAPQQY